MIPKIANRSDLVGLLTEACELEHGIACSYLFTAFTLKQELAEGDITWEQLQKIRKWAGQIFFVASQEMLHLSLVWNILNAVGGTPYYLRPNFPQKSKYYPLNLPITLEPFGERAVKRFIYYEKPLGISRERAAEVGIAEFDDDQIEYCSIGQLYQIIATAINELPEDRLFIANPGLQVGTDLADFPNIVKVTNRESALAAIEEITEQGEGTPQDRDDSHFGMFRGILKDLKDEHHRSSEAGEKFSPARPCIENPVAKLRGDYGAHGNLISDIYTQQVAELFDSIYSLMLRLLSYVFCNATSDPRVLREFAGTSMRIMTTVIKPLGEALTLLPAGENYGILNAGPAFGLSRQVVLPSEAGVARIVVGERLRDLHSIGERLAQQNNAPTQLLKAVQKLTELQFKDV